MAEGVRRLLRADAAVAVTGAGGPGTEEGKPPGTVFVATSIQGRVVVKQYSFDGDPGTVVEKTVESALSQLAAELDKGQVGAPSRP
jgi:nicotinamide-nucleotide amidase